MFLTRLFISFLAARIGSRTTDHKATHVVLAVCLAVGIIFSSPLKAQVSVETLEEPDQPWQIEADEVGYDDVTKQYIAKGNVTIKKRDISLTADFIRFDSQSMTAVAIGNVVMTVAGDILVGNSIEINLVSETGTIYQGSIFLKESHFYIKGDKLKKIGKDTYVAEKASISTCDGEPPAWRITGRNLKITIEGFGTVKHGTMWARKVPVLYSPYLVFPTKRKRQSGFLFPKFGSSDRKGFRYIQPFFWAISDNTDATFFWDHMDSRGEKFGAEYRYLLSRESKGTVMFDYLNDKEIDEGTGDSSEKFGFADDNALRPNSDRYWFRMKVDQELPYDFSGKLDLDIVSDQDYLSEFREGITGFDQAEEYFSGTFGRGFNDYTDRVRKNLLNIQRRWSGYQLNVSAEYFDDVVLRRQSDIDPTLQKLPLVEFDLSRKRIFESPFYIDLDSEYVYFFRKDGQTGHRTDILPRFYAPVRVRNYFTFEPSVGVRDTLWYLDKLEDKRFEGDRIHHRLIPDVSADVLTEVFNVYNFRFGRIDKIKHTLRPQAVYSFTPHVDQSDLPFFDDTDRIAEENLLTYSLTQTLISRSIAKKAAGTEKTQKKQTKQNELPEYDYNQFLRFKLEQSYDIKKALDDEPRPFSSVAGRLDFVPFRYFSLEATAKWSPYDNDLPEHNVAATLSDGRGDRLVVEHRYSKDQNESIYFDTSIKLSERLRIYGDYEHNLLDDIRIRSSVGVLYSSQCWSIDMRYVDEISDQRYVFAITLVGLGQVRRSFQGRIIGNPFGGF
ncbi:MAG: LPS-assembly protein LptD [Deltaproteobacteria bacterium]|nr:LPS-assembly protein LptD [Deltaproteobacteria bacterium]